MKNYKQGFGTAVILIAIAILIGGGFYLYSTNNLKPQVADQVNSDIVTSSKNSSNDLKTYSNISLGLSLQYPKNWIIHEKNDAVWLQFVKDSDITFGITTYSNPPSNIESILPIFSVPNRKVDARELVTINGKVWTKLIVDKDQVVLYTISNAKAYVVQYADNNDLQADQSEKIANTIKFVENVKTYTNEQYGFEFNYPSYATVKKDSTDGIMASLNLSVITGKEKDFLDAVTVRVYTKQADPDLFSNFQARESDNEKVVVGRDFIIQIFGGADSDLSLLNTVKSSIKIK